jgi:hypothetical protein
MKTCSTCKTTKEISQFSKNKAQTDGLANVCKSCFAIYAKKYREENKETISQKDHIYWITKRKEVQAKQYKENKHEHKDYKLKTTYGISLDDYRILLKKQNYCCGICEKPRSDFKIDFAVDHCHLTGTIRGLLCGNCNNGLGRFKDNTNIVGKAFLYLQRYV